MVATSRDQAKCVQCLEPKQVERRRNHLRDRGVRRGWQPRLQTSHPLPPDSMTRKVQFGYPSPSAIDRLRHEGSSPPIATKRPQMIRTAPIISRPGHRNASFGLKPTRSSPQETAVATIGWTVAYKDASEASACRKAQACFVRT
eukprot:TRINITY_DN29543_c0_g1_i1.p1 TRINITY_DN29543_c0_g1~~TRINITY_DN29543_c0_g1_i1.p1  ORF type:complete len:144 (-),score=3.24 TRINITY_DN29543_c0_g1_i1:136-567(-)